MSEPVPAHSPDPNLQASSPPILRVWFGLQDEVSRGVYVASGVGLMLVKYCCEAVATFYFTGHALTPWEFLTPLLNNRVDILSPAPDWVGPAMLAWTLPFVWIAFSMSVRRAANAGTSAWTGVLILVPLVNLVVMFILAIVPARRRSIWDLSPRPASPATVAETRAVPVRKTRSLLAILAGMLVGLSSVGLSVYGLGEYGAALFFGAPILMGCITGFVFNYEQPQSWGATVGISSAMLFAAGSCLLMFALEGIICLLMAAPLFLPLVILGGLLGKAVAGATHTSISQTVGMLLVLPLMAGVETAQAPDPPEYVVTSHVEIDAPPETVWKYVVEFPDLPEPDDWFFRVGIACPMRARIEGHGVGATRYCEFTTGSFVEPITTWDEPKRLAFDVTSQPDPMRELSPYRHVHPPHLADASLKSRRGEFRLVALPGRRTRLEGRTWYTFEMYPQAYWTLWSDVSIHKIHDRVLAHIKQLSEAENPQ